MTQDLLLNLMPSLPFGEASGPLVAAMYSGRLKRSDLEVWQAVGLAAGLAGVNDEEAWC